MTARQLLAFLFWAFAVLGCLVGAVSATWINTAGPPRWARFAAGLAVGVAFMAVTQLAAYGILRAAKEAE